MSKLYVDLLKSGGHGGKPLAVPTVRHVHRTLRKALNDAVLIDGVLSSNPALLAKLPRETRRVTRSMWMAEDLDVFLESISGHRLHAFYRVAAFTGARRGEVLHLRWSDLDLEEDIIRFEGSTGVVDGERIDGTTKGGRSRVVGIDGGTRRVLEKRRLARDADRELAGPDWFVSDLVFTSQLGRPLHPDTPTQLMPKLIEAHNSPATPPRRNHPAEPLPRPGHQLPHVRLDDLRHLHATLLLLEGVPVHVVANRLGHSDPAVTLRVYAHVLRESASPVTANTPNNPPDLGGSPAESSSTSATAQSRSWRPCTCTPGRSSPNGSPATTPRRSSPA